MGDSILSREDRYSLGNGMHLRLLSARQLMDARAQAAELASDPAERPLCSNACLVARCLWVDGEDSPLFESAGEVLDTLTAEEIEALAGQWDVFRRNCAPGASEQVEYGVNPNFDAKFAEERGK